MNSSQPKIHDILLNIIHKNQETSSTIQNNIIYGQLCHKLVSKQYTNLSSFTEYLQEQCQINSRIILNIFEQLMSHHELNKRLRNKITSEYTLFKIYQSMDLLKSQEYKQKRREIRQILNNIDQKGERVKKLVIQYWQGMKNQHQQTKQIQQDQQVSCEGEQDYNFKQKLNDLISDYKEMFPQHSFQKHLQKEIILSYIHKNPKGKNIVERLLPQIDSLANKIQQLQHHYKQEYRIDCQNVQQIFNKIQKNKGQKTYQNLCYIKSKLFSLNVLELERLIRKTKNAQKCIEGKDVLLFIGNTGVGKSTFILKFLGYTLKEGKYKKLTTLVPNEDLDEKHKSFKTSPQAKSCTRYVNSVNVPDSMYLPDTISKTLVICDSPGFGDSAGIEVDIANSTGTINALQKAKSLRIVLIFSYEQITADRSKELITLSQTVSILLDESAIECVTVLFNKVSLDKIMEVEVLIRNKISVSTISDQKMKKLLNLIHYSSKIRQNFVDPLQTDFKTVFNNILQTKFITEIKDHLHYQFPQRSKRVLRNFIANKQNSIRDYISANRFDDAKYNIVLLQKLSDLGSYNGTVLKELKLLVQKLFQKELERFKYYISKIVLQQNKQNINNLLNKINASRQILTTIEKEFRSTYLININPYAVDNIIQQNELLLLNQFNNITEVNLKTISAVKQFTKYLSSQLSTKIQQILQKQMNRCILILSNIINSKNFKEMSEPISRLLHVKKLIEQIDQNPQNDYSNKQLNEIKNFLSTQLEKGIFQIQQSVKDLQYRLRQSIIDKINKYIQQTQRIQSFNFIQNKQKLSRMITQQLLKDIQLKCKKSINELKNIKFHIDDQKSIYNQKNMFLRKKRQIDLIMKIKYIKPKMQDYYDEMLLQIKRQIQENLLTLKQLMENSLNVINLDKIIQYARTIIVCSKQIGQEFGNQITTKIQDQLIKYCNSTVRMLDLKYRLVTPQLIAKIEKQSNKIQALSKMGTITPKIKDKIALLKQQFLQTLKTPFIQYKTQIQQQENHYKCFLYKTNKLQKLTHYSLQLQKILFQNYSLISQNQSQLILYLSNICNYMQKDIVNFLSYQFQFKKYPQYLKELIRNLLRIREKESLCVYICCKMGFDVQEQLSHIQFKFDLIKEKFKELHNRSNRSIEDLEKIIADCKFYAQIQQIYRYRSSQSLGWFQTLQRQCQKQLNQIIKQNQDRVVQLIRGNYSRVLYFQEIKRYYKLFISLSANLSKNGREIIKKQLAIVEKSQIDELKRFYNQMGDISFFKNKNRVESFKQKYEQVIKLQLEMKNLYTLEDDRKYICDKDILRKIKRHIVDIYKEEFDNLFQSIKSYVVLNKEKLTIFESIQSSIYQIFEIQEKNIEYLIYQQGFGLITKQILNHPYSQSIYLNNNKEIRLKKMLQIYNKGISKEIKEKYSIFSQKFIIDSNFIKYYNNSKDSNKQQIEQCVCSYVQDLIRKYKNSQQDQSLKEQIAKAINILPKKRRGGYEQFIRNKLFIKIKMI